MNMDSILKELEPVAEKLIELNLHEEPELYQAWLEQTYFFVCHSVPLLKVAANTASDPNFQKRCLDHIKEESGHDKVALSDLKELGVKASSLKEWEWTRNFYQTQYSLTHERGEMLLGYILALEGLAILSAPFIGPLIEAYGKRATKFAKIHAEEDMDHLPHAVGQTMLLDCREEIIENFRAVLNEYSAFIDQLEELKVHRDQKTAA